MEEAEGSESHGYTLSQHIRQTESQKTAMAAMLHRSMACKLKKRKLRH